MDYVLYEQGVTVRAGEGAEVASRIVNPYFNRTWEHFCSHRHTPPDTVAGEPFVVVSPRTAYAAHPLFTDYAVGGCRVYRDIVCALIERLAGEPFVLSDLPTTAEMTLRRQRSSLVLHVIHYIIQRKCRTLETVEEAIPLFERRFQVRTQGRPRSVSLAPQETQIPFSWESGRCSFTIPRIDGHQMAVIEE